MPTATTPTAVHSHQRSRNGVLGGGAGDVVAATVDALAAVAGAAAAGAGLVAGGFVAGGSLAGGVVGGGFVAAASFLNLSVPASSRLALSTRLRLSACSASISCTYLRVSSASGARSSGVASSRNRR